jgi:hypothetical protein
MEKNMIKDILKNIKFVQLKINSIIVIFKKIQSLLLIIITYSLYIALNQFEFVTSQIIIHRIFVLVIILTFLNCFVPNAVQSFFGFWGKIAYSIFITLILINSYIIPPYIVVNTININELHTIFELVVYFSILILFSTILSGLLVLILRKKPNYIISILKGKDFINITFIEEFYDKNIDNLIRILYLIFLIISGILTFIFSFVPLFFELVDNDNNQLDFKNKPMYFAVLVVLIQLVLHGQIVEVFKKNKRNAE